MLSIHWRSLFFGLIVLSGLELAAVPPLSAGEKNSTKREGTSLPEGAIARLGTVSYRHASQVVSVAYSANGELLATGDHSESVRLWELATGKERFRFLLEGDPPYDGRFVALAPAGELLAGASGDVFGVWDVATGKERLKRSLPKGERASGIAFGPGGKTLAVLSWRNAGIGPQTESVFRLWNVAQGKVVGSFPVPAGYIRAIAFSPDGKLLALGQEDALQLCDPHSGKKLRTLSSKKTRFDRVAFSVAGILATPGEDNKTVQLWDAATGDKKHLLRGHEGPVSALSFAADGRRLVSSSTADSSFRVWDVASGDTLLVHRGLVSVGGGCVALSPDGKTVAEGSVNRVSTVAFWDVATGRERTGTPGHLCAVCWVAFTKNGKVVTGGDYGDNTVRLWEAADGKQISLLQEADLIKRVGVSPDGQTVAFVNKDNTVCLRDFGTGKEGPTLVGGAGSVQALDFAPDGKTLAVGYCQTSKGYVCTLMIWEVSSGKRLRQFPTPGISIHSVVFTPDGKKLVSTSAGMRMWNPTTGKALGEFPMKGASVSGHGVVRFSADGALVAAPSYPKGFAVWRVATRAQLGRFDGDGITVRSVAFSADGRLLACGKEDGSVELWQVQKWQVVGKGQGPRGRVCALRFSADSRTLISGHEDTTALVWSVAKLLGQR